MQDQIIVKQITGIMWAADILSGRKPFPSYNKEEIKSKDSSDDFARIFAKELKERAQEKGASSSS